MLLARDSPVLPMLKEKKAARAELAEEGGEN